jgi:hypothetical protein
MSKKTIPFALPPKPALPDHAAEETPDRWVFQAEPPPAGTAGHVVIDLSANRTWYELAQLIWIFPCLATTCWMRTATQTWLESFKGK